jgi:hypothetical protein
VSLKLWSSITSGSLSNPPAIAFVDSGIQNRLDFAGRLVQRVSISGGATADSHSDAYGHGTFPMRCS